MIKFFPILFLFLLCTKIHSSVEHLVVKKNKYKIIKNLDTLSLKIFKKIRSILFVVGALESTFTYVFQPSLFLFGAFLVLTGIAIRLLAIINLGQLWNYNVVLYDNHKVIRTGIYRYINHPAYLGNIFIVGIFICSNSLFTATISLFFITVFYLYRSNIENNIISKLEKVNERPTSVSRNIEQGI